MLLADTLTFVVPNGQLIVEPGDVPQPPVHDSRVTAHCDGSVNPSWAGEIVAPSGELPLTVMLPLPRNCGSVFCSDASASARPDPNTLSGAASLSGVALATTKLRSVPRAPGGSSAPADPEIRHGAA